MMYSQFNKPRGNKLIFFIALISFLHSNYVTPVEVRQKNHTVIIYKLVDNWVRRLYMIIGSAMRYVRSYN